MFETVTPLTVAEAPPLTVTAKVLSAWSGSATVAICEFDAGLPCCLELACAAKGRQSVDFAAGGKFRCAAVIVKIVVAVGVVRRRRRDLLRARIEGESNGLKNV
jgi:hypothetical protein